MFRVAVLEAMRAPMYLHIFAGMYTCKMICTCMAVSVHELLQYVNGHAVIT